LCAQRGLICGGGLGDLISAISAGLHRGQAVAVSECGRGEREHGQPRRVVAVPVGYFLSAPHGGVDAGCKAASWRCSFATWSLRSDTCWRRPLICSTAASRESLSSLLRARSNSIC